MLMFLRQAGLMDHVPGSFDAAGTRLRLSRPMKRESEAEDLLGRSLPDHVIAQLDAHLDRLGDNSADFAQLGWSAEDIRRMYRTVYQLIRDTGRRPHEVTTLKIGCLTYVDDKPLIYDNHKSGRLGLVDSRSRRPRQRSSGDRQHHLAGLPTRGSDWMFPSPGLRGRRVHGGGHLTAGNFGGRVFRVWVDTIPSFSTKGSTRTV